MAVSGTDPAPAPGAGGPDPAPTPDPGANGPDPTPAPSPAPTGWQAQLSEEHRAALAPKNFPTPDDLAKSYLELESHLGKKTAGVTVPGENATPDELEAFNAQLRPESADAYVFPEPEGREPTETDKALEAAMRASFHKHGVLPHQAHGIAADFAHAAAAAETALDDAKAKTIEEGNAKLREAWGSAFDERLAMARDLVRNTDGMADELKHLDLQNAPLVSQALAELQSYIMEDTGMPGGLGAKFSHTPEGARIEINRMKEHPEISKALTDKSHNDHKLLNEKLDRLQRIATGVM